MATHDYCYFLGKVAARRATISLSRHAVTRPNGLPAPLSPPLPPQWVAVNHLPAQTHKSPPNPHT